MSMCRKNVAATKKNLGTRGGVRTRDLLIHNQAL
jgi:hypothetical protein